MAGHNKWSKIKRKKGVADAKRGQVFTKLGKMISLAAREGGGDPDMNFKLKLAIDKAKQANMPADNISRAIERGVGGGKDGEQIEEMVYEVYGPNGTAAIVTVLTDNKNRAIADLKMVFSKQGGSLGGSGSVAWMFDRKGVVVAKKSSIKDLDELTLEGIDQGVTDVEEEDDTVDFYSLPGDLKKMRDFLASKGAEIESAELIYRPQNLVKVEDEDKREKMIDFLEAIEDLDDVDRVDSNVEF